MTLSCLWDKMGRIGPEIPENKLLFYILELRGFGWAASKISVILTGIKHFPKFLQNWSFPKGTQCHPPCWREKWHQCISATLLFHWTQCFHIYLQLGLMPFLFMMSLCLLSVTNSSESLRSIISGGRSDLLLDFRFLCFSHIFKRLFTETLSRSLDHFSSVSVLCFDVDTGEASQLVFSLWSPLKYCASLQRLVRAAWDPMSRISVVPAW